MEKLEIESQKIYNVLYNYKTDSVEISGDDVAFIDLLQKTIKAEPALGLDFINLFNNELYLLEKNGGTLRFESEFFFNDSIKHLIVKGSFNKEKELFRGYLIDDTISNNLNQKAMQTNKLKSISTLAAGVAHDFNNHLMVITASCELLKRNIGDEKLISYIKNIEQSTRKSSELINKLLTYGQNNNIPKINFDLVSVVNQSMYFLKRNVRENISVIYDCIQKDLIVYGNSELVEGAILNVCQNAFESIAKNGVILVNLNQEYLHEIPNDVCYNHKFTSGNYACITISDNGCGIKSSDLDKVFDPFFTTKDFDKKAGLGLSTVVGTIESHNGMIGIESGVNRGTTIKLYFKINEGVSVRMKNKKKIMIIDDEYLVRMVLKDILTDFGYEVLSFESGVSAVEHYKLNKDDIDLVICDMVMPVMNGKEVLDELVKIDDKLKFIILSGYSNQEKDLGPYVIEYLTKPVMLNYLGDVIENALK